MSERNNSAGRATLWTRDLGPNTAALQHAGQTVMPALQWANRDIPVLMPLAASGTDQAFTFHLVDVQCQEAPLCHVRLPLGLSPEEVERCVSDAMNAYAATLN